MNVRESNYIDFSQKRERLISALRELEDDESDVNALSVLQAAIDDNADTIEYLKYMTPFYKQVIASRFHDMSKVDWEVCEYAAERVLNVDREDDEMLISWVFEKVRELYTYCGDIVLTVLSDLRTEYIRQNPNLDPSLVFEFGREPLDRLDADSVSIWEDEDDEIDTRHFQGLWVDIESQIGYLGVVYAFLNTANLEYSNLWLYTDLVHVRYDHRLDKDRTFNIYAMYGSVKDCVTGNDTEDHGGFVPMWMVNTVHSMDFYCESIHLTPSKSGRYAKGSLDVTPKTLQTKLSDYKSAAWATYGRDLPLVTSVGAPRGLVFSWSEHILCRGGFQQTRNNLDSLFFAGENCIFLFSKSNVTLCRETDFVLETVSLLSAVEETIPCIVEYVHPEHIAFIGQQGDLPILVIDESDDPPRPFVCYVLSELCKYLLSGEYQASDNLNSVPVLTRAQVDGYLVNQQRPNPSREWFETQSLQNDENGFLINPDTGGTLWYHGSKYGGLGDGHVLYFSSDIDIARTMACQMFCYSEDDCTATVYKAKLKTRADEIFDARCADSSKNAKSLAEHLNLEHPYDEYSLDFDNFDEKLGYHAQTNTDIAYAQSLGFKGWLEVEDTTGDPEPCTIGLFTNEGMHYEIVDTLELSAEDCEGFY